MFYYYAVRFEASTIAVNSTALPQFVSIPPPHFFAPPLLLVPHVGKRGFGYGGAVGLLAPHAFHPSKWPAVTLL